ncbi:MAG: glycosyltransferase family 2 protein [bacterium]|nr:glycosyltransferase family 2 protein [bacterium]
MKVSVIAPFYNEEEVAERVVLDILSALRTYGEFEFICVEDASTDNTGEILKNLSINNKELRVIETGRSLGYGNAIRRGLEAASGEIVGYIDGDGQVAPEDMLRVLRLMNFTRAAKAKRVERQDGWKRVINSKIFNSLMFLFFGFLSSDVNAKPKFLKKEDLQKMKLVSNGWFIDSELMLKAKKLGIKWEEIPIKFKKRKEGVSKVNLLSNAECLKNIFLWRVGRRIPLWQKNIS